MDSGVKLSKNVYVDALTTYIQDLQRELEDIESSLDKHKIFLGNLENRKAEISMEIERVKMRIGEIHNGKTLEEMGMGDPLSEHNANALTNSDKKIDTIEKEMSELKKQYSESDNFTEKMIIKNKIEFKDKQLDMLYKKRIKIGKRQRTIVLAKNKIESLRSRGINKQQVKVAKAEAKAEEINAKIEASVESDDPLAALIENARDAQKKYYQRKAENARAVLEKMDNHSFIKGARAIAVARVGIEKLREIIKNNEMNDTLTADRTNTPATPPGAGESQDNETPVVDKPGETAAEMASAPTAFDLEVARLTGRTVGQ